MATDCGEFVLPRKKYPDEKWKIPVDWTNALKESTPAGNPVVTAYDGLVVDDFYQDANVTMVSISGGGPGASMNTRFHVLLPTSSGEDLSYNIIVPMRTI